MAMWCMCTACCMPKAIDIHLTICKTQSFSTASVYTSAPQCYVICRAPVLFYTVLFSVRSAVSQKIIVFSSSVSSSQRK